MPRENSGSSKVWVLQHHDEFKVVESADRPDTETDIGERMKLVYGPFTNRDAAEKYSNNMKVRTLRHQGEQ